MQLSEDDVGVNSNGDVAEDYRNTDENPSSSYGTCKENGNSRLLIKRYDLEEAVVLFELVLFSSFAPSVFFYFVIEFFSCFIPAIIPLHQSKNQKPPVSITQTTMLISC